MDPTVDSVSASPLVFSAAYDPNIDPYPPAGLAPGQSVQIDVSYRPTRSSIDTGFLSIASNGGQGQLLRIPLAGQGLAVQPCQLLAAPAALNFAQRAGRATPRPRSLLRSRTSGPMSASCRIWRFRTICRGDFHVLSTSLEPDPETG